jgi:hypothetical protein
MLNERLSDFGPETLRTRVPKGRHENRSLFNMWPLEWDGGWVRQTRSFDWKMMRREHEMFLSPRGALCRGMPRDYVANRFCEVSAHEISSDRPDLSLFGLSVFRPPPPPVGR